MMIIAAATFAVDERAWAQAMMAEYEEAKNDGRAFSFAVGCLAAALWRLPVSPSGRHLILRYALVLGLILPFAAFHLICASTGLRYLLTGYDAYLSALANGNARQREIGALYVEIAPVLTFLLAALGASHIAAAWHIASSNWRSAAWSMATAVPVVVLLLTCIMLLHPTARGLLLQVVALAAEAFFVPALARLEVRHNGKMR